MRGVRGLLDVQAALDEGQCDQEGLRDVRGAFEGYRIQLSVNL